MSNQRRVDGAVGFGLALAFGAAAICVIPDQAAPGDEGEIAPALLPVLAAALVAILGLGQLIAAWGGPGDVGDGAGLDGRAALFAVAAAVVLAVAVTAIAWTGFLVGGIATVAAVGFAMRPAGPARWWLLGIAVVLPTAAYGLAWYGLRIALP